MSAGTTCRFLAASLAAIAAGVAVLGCGSSSGQKAPVVQGATLTVERGTVGPPIPAGFVGLSMEYRGLASYAGSDPHAPNPVFEQLLRNLSPGQGLVLRIGGQSTERTWWPVANLAPPKWAQYSLGPNWAAVARALTQSIGARLILGINLEADSTQLASAEVQGLLSGIGPGRIEALEIGNEPEQFGSFPWYQFPAGVHHFGRPHSYDFKAYLNEFSTIAQAVPGVALAGPSTGGVEWIPQLPQFLSAEPRVKVATLHAYPLKHCRRNSVVAMSQLLSPSASAGLAAKLAPYAAIAHAHDVPLRIDEMNAVSCGGAAGVSDTFGAALWALDSLFSMARDGVDGINIHTVPGTITELFGVQQTGSEWRSNVHPEYYGLMLFAHAAPAGSRLLRIAGGARPGLRAWATRADDGKIRVTLINKSLSVTRVLRLRVTGAAGPAKLERLLAPSIDAQDGITLGGESFGQSTSTGRLQGRSALTSIRPAHGVYVVRIPAASAAMLTLAAR